MWLGVCHHVSLPTPDLDYQTGDQVFISAPAYAKSIAAVCALLYVYRQVITSDREGVVCALTPFGLWCATVCVHIRASKKAAAVARVAAEQRLIDEEAAAAALRASKCAVACAASVRTIWRDHACEFICRACVRG